jgi:hypothetical protein
MTLSILLGLGFTWLVAPICLFLAVARLTGETGNERWTLIGLCWGFAPAVISRIVTWTLYIAEGRSDVFYVSVVGAVFAGLGLYGLPRTALLQRMLADGTAWMWRWRWTILVSIATAGTVVALIARNHGRAALIRSYGWAAGTWDPTPISWAAIMPRFAAVILLLFVAVLVIVGVGRSRAPGHMPVPTSEIATVTLVGAALAAVLAAASCLMLALLVFENDALQYFHVAGLLYQVHSLAQYPVIPAAPDGTYASSAHPLGQYGLLIWGMMIAGAPVSGPGKLLVLSCCFATLIGIAIALGRHGAIAIASAMLLLVTTPGYFAQLIGSGIDPSRLALVLLATLAIVWAARKSSWAAWSCAGISIGLALNSHSESLLPVTVMIGAIVFLRWTPSWHRRLAAAAIAGGIAIAVGGERFVLNVLLFGAPVYNDLPIWRLVPELQYLEWRASVVPPHGWLGLLVKGPLLGFTDWYMFGFTWWLALLAGICHWRTLGCDATLRAVAGIGVGTFVLIAAYLSVPRTGELLIGNYRYLLCLQPVAVILAGLLIARMVEPRAHAA